VQGRESTVYHYILAGFGVKHDSNMARGLFSSLFDCFKIVAGNLGGEMIQSGFYPGDLVTLMGNQEVWTICRRIPDNPGELTKNQRIIIKMKERSWAMGIT